MLGVGRGLHSEDDFQNLMDCSLYHPQALQKISSKSIHNFLSHPVNRQTNTQTNAAKTYDLCQNSILADIYDNGDSNRNSKDNVDNNKPCWGQLLLGLVTANIC